MNSNKILDYVLRFIYRELEFAPSQVAFQFHVLYEKINGKSLHKYLNNEGDGFTLTDADLTEVLEKLNNDGYIKHRLFQGINPTYSYETTFEGRWFIQQGGYSRKAFKDFTTSIFQILTTALVALGAVVATIYYSHELLKNHIPFVSALTYLFLLIACNIAVLILFLIGREIKKPTLPSDT